MALTQDRNTPLYEGEIYAHPVAADTVIFAGALACLDASGNLVPGAVATGLIAAGRAEEHVDNSGGSAGDERCRVRRGIFRWKNSAAGDAITRAEIGDACFIVDDETVAKTDGSAARSKAGIIVDVDAQGVWVSTGEEILNSPASALLAANNLSDVGTKATARANLGVYERLGTPAFTIGDEIANVRNVAVQLKDSAGVNLAVRANVLAYLSTDSGGGNLVATAPDGGVAIGANGVAIPLVADKAFRLTTNATGAVDLDIEESGDATYYLTLVMPDGRLVVSNAIAFAS